MEKYKRDYEGCNREFTNMFNVERHKITHETNRTRYECQTCEKSFYRFDNMMHHARHCGGSIRNDNEEEEEDEENEDEDNEVVSKEKYDSNSSFKVSVVRTAFRNANITWSLKYMRGNTGVKYDTVLHSS